MDFHPRRIMEEQVLTSTATVGVAFDMKSCQDKASIFTRTTPCANFRVFSNRPTSYALRPRHQLVAKKPSNVQPEWRLWRSDALPILLDLIPVPRENLFGQSHKPKIASIRQALRGVEHVIIATDPATSSTSASPGASRSAFVTDSIGRTAA